MTSVGASASAKPPSQSAAAATPSATASTDTASRIMPRPVDPEDRPYVEFWTQEEMRRDERAEKAAKKARWQEKLRAADEAPVNPPPAADDDDWEDMDSEEYESDEESYYSGDSYDLYEYSDSEGPYWRPSRLGSKGLEAEPTGSLAKLSRQGFDRLCTMYNAADAQDPNLGSWVYVVRHEEGYGKLKVLHGQVAEYDRLRTSAHVMDSWPIVEAMAFFFIGEDDMGWQRFGDGEIVREFTELVGAMFLDCLRRLDQEGLLRPDSPIENLGLVMGVMMRVADDWDLEVGRYEIDWATELMELAREKGIEMRTVTATISPYERPAMPEPHNEEQSRRDEQDREERRRERGGEYNFPRMLKEYKRNYRNEAGWKRACIDLSKPEVRANIARTLKEVSRTSRGAYTWHSDEENEAELH